ncbi:hypothetical protein [Bacillus chungangensis]|uniref:LysM domain-containing protein n=1 Tax=Bacillus chungangensis TaxID=587633 RepID=A0ABT9WQZ7_9BACI|nr:hypothetical protein [Bacillus chungangensis]MDQ0175200.1 hypothetical protein [Bacillus chungangensis]
MKKIIAFLLTATIGYSIYHDITNGTLEVHSTNKTLQDNTEIETSPFIAIAVQPGDTVLSVVEQLQQAPLSASISQVTNDFMQLNKGTRPEDIQVGKTYNFPVYLNEED